MKQQVLLVLPLAVVPAGVAVLVVMPLWVVVVVAGTVMVVVLMVKHP
jgi:hypothetical protein